MTYYQHNLVSVFSDLASLYPEKAALCYSEKSYSFSEIEKYANSLAVYLLNQGCQRGDVIAIAHDKRPLSFALMIAALRIGVAYVNFDPESPVLRINSIVQTCSPKLLFFENPDYKPVMLQLVETAECKLVQLDVDVLPLVSNENIRFFSQNSKCIDGSTIAYIMFTSGSTGTPKGVAVTHQNLLHFIAWGRERFEISERDNFANLSPMYFDNSVFDFYVGLFNGASISPICRELLSKPYELVSYVSERCCTIWFSVPSALMYLVAVKAITPKALSDLRVIVFGGEGYPKVELKKLFDRFDGQAKLVNVYGPTECTCICSAYTLGACDFHDLEGLPTLGFLNPNFDHRILNENDQDAAEGELCLIGPNVAAGYFNDNKLSSRAFFTITDANRYMKRMYRTGDLVKKIEGKLYFIGRKDNQIKHLGYRIELEEIENALVNFSEVDQAAVIYVRTTNAYGKLIAFIASSALVDDSALLNSLRSVIPDYMIPSRLIVMESLPKNANGKIDKNALKSSI